MMVNQSAVEAFTTIPKMAVADIERSVRSATVLNEREGQFSIKEDQTTAL